MHVNRSIVIDHLLKTFKNDNDVGIAFIYCTYEDKDKVLQTPINLIASLWMQLLSSTPLSKEAIVLHKTRAESRSRPSLGEISQIFHTEIARYSKVFIVVDALDELSEDMGIRESLLAELRSLPATVRLMVTSRDIHNISDGFKDADRREIYANEGDMRKYLGSYTAHLHSCVKENTILQEMIISKIVQIADGM